MQRENNLLNQVPPGEYRQAVQAILDKAYRVINNQRVGWTGFYEPGLIKLATPVLKQVLGLRVEISGGYDQAERVRLIFTPDWQEKKPEARIGILAIQHHGQSKKLSHRDYLGSLLGLGIKREKLGDLIVLDTGCQVFLEKDLMEYIMFNLNKVASIQVVVTEITEGQLMFPELKGKEMFVTVASLRLDVVLAAAFNLSREKVALLVKGEKVKLNWLTNTNRSAQVKQGDLISCRGKGRIKVLDIPGKTKKGRVQAILQKFS